MSETSGMRTVDYVPQSIGYRQSHAICRRTYGKETKAKPTIRIYLHTMLTGDTLNRSAVRAAMVIEPENPAWVRSVRSSPRELMALTWRRNAVYATLKGKVKGRRNLNETNI